MPTRATTAAAALRALETRRDRYDAAAAPGRLARLRTLERARLRSAGAVRRLHETLCFLRAYPDSPAVLRQVDRMLAAFDRRADLRALRDELAHSGIAGTVAWFPYFWPTARWLARRWPALLRFDRADTVAQAALEHWLPRLVTPVEGDALRASKLPGFAALDALMRRPAAAGEGDAAFLIGCIEAFGADDRVREAIYDAINPSCELLPGPGTPSRTRTRLGAAPLGFRSQPLRRLRPDLRAEAARPPRSFARVAEGRGAAIVDVARATLAVRQRDLDAFAHGNARDVWLADDGDGLAFALVGMLPARRAPIVASYGLLTLQNGVPIGYGQADIAGRLAALSFNSFETFRGGESAFVFARFLAALRALFGVDSVCLDPYQLGHDNDEAIASGAWWFYAKLGFAPRAPSALRLMRREQRRLRARPDARSTPQTLRALARSHVFFDLDPRRPAPLPDLAGWGLRAAAQLAQHAARNGDRARAAQAIAREALAVCGVGSWRGWSADERRAWLDWAPLVSLMSPRAWRAAERADLVRLVRAKAAASELPFALALARHTRVAAVLLGDRPARRAGGVPAARPDRRATRRAAR
jgi:hypothetical protein